MCGLTLRESGGSAGTHPDLHWPADMYLEGRSTPGWFHSSLLAAVGTRQAAPIARC
jgi:isoleucyl-tRNA synthetase